MRKIQNTQLGQSLFELVVAIAISALVIVAIVSLVSSSIRNATFSKNSAQASAFAQTAVEWLRSERDTDTATFIVHAQTPIWCLKDLNLSTASWSADHACGENDFITGTIFQREVHFTNLTVNSKSVVQADMVVKWNDSQGVHEVVNSTSFTDWRQR